MTGQRDRWAELTGGQAGEEYARRFARLAASGQDVHGEAAFCTALVKPAAKVLDAGCGTGRVAIRLAELGHRCTGVDVDTSMLAVARREAPGQDWRAGDLARLDALGLDADFDLVLAAGNVIPLLAPGTGEAVAAHLAAALRPDGLLDAGMRTRPGTPAAGGSAPDSAPSTGKLALLVEDLMEMSRFDARVAELNTDEVDAAEAVRRTLSGRRWHERVGTELPDGIRVRLDPRRFDVIVANLVGNALRHGAEPVTVRLSRRAGALAVEVRDHGAGIADTVLPHVFDRFYKADAARSRSPGSGLGLAIVQENVRLHGGTVDARNAPGGGALFTVERPFDGPASRWPGQLVRWELFDTAARSRPRPRLVCAAYAVGPRLLGDGAARRPKKALWSVTVRLVAAPCPRRRPAARPPCRFAGPRTVTLPATTGTDCHVVPSYETRTRSD
ncbi:Sensor histidine kinase RcsC [Streptomyces californicus]